MKDALIPFPRISTRLHCGNECLEYCAERQQGSLLLYRGDPI